MSRFIVGAVVTTAMAVAPAAAAAQATLTRETSQYHLVMTDAADAVTIQGGTANHAPLLDFVPTGASAVPWTLSAPACNQDAKTFRVRCTQDVAPLTVEMGAGDDTVNASSSNVAVWLDGGAGKDTLTGGPGDDTVVSRDDAADTVDCGPGNDTAIADASDTVTNCETVDIPPPPPPPPAPSSSLGATPAGSSAPAPLARISGTIGNSFLVGLRSARVQRLTVRGTPFDSRIALSCRGRGCPRSMSRTGPDASFTKALKKVRLRVGAVLELRLTAPNVIGRVVRFTVAKRRVRTATLCLAPGAAAPARCGPGA